MNHNSVFIPLATAVRDVNDKSRFGVFMPGVYYLTTFLEKWKFVSYYSEDEQLSKNALTMVLAIQKWCFISSDIPICIENIGGAILLVVVLSKFIITRLCETKIEKLYMMIADNWMSLDDSEEYSIIEDYARKSYRESIVYFVFLLVNALCFTQLSMINPVLDFIFPLNTSRPKILVVRAEYIIDPYDYFYEIYIMYCIMGIILCCVASAVDTTLSLVAHQCAGIFRIVEYRLMKASAYRNEAQARTTMASAIKLHYQGLHFVEIIESSYSLYFLLMIGGTLIFSFGSCLIAENPDELQLTIKIIIFEIGIMTHMFYISWPGQLIHQESGNIFLSAYNNSWYTSSKQVKGMLVMVMQRSIKPSILLAGGLYTMDFRNAGLVLKTFISYMTFAQSLFSKD